MGAASLTSRDLCSLADMTCVYTDIYRTLRSTTLRAYNLPWKSWFQNNTLLLYFHFMWVCEFYYYYYYYWTMVGQVNSNNFSKYTSMVAL